LIGLLTGNVDLNQHLTLMKVRSDPTCLLGRRNVLSFTRLTLFLLYGLYRFR